MEVDVHWFDVDRGGVLWEFLYVVVGASRKSSSVIGWREGVMYGVMVVGFDVQTAWIGSDKA